MQQILPEPGTGGGEEGEEPGKDLLEQLWKQGNTNTAPFLIQQIERELEHARLRFEIQATSANQ